MIRANILEDIHKQVITCSMSCAVSKLVIFTGRINALCKSKFEADKISMALTVYNVSTIQSVEIHAFWRVTSSRHQGDLS